MKEEKVANATKVGKSLNSFGQGFKLLFENVAKLKYKTVFKTVIILLMGIMVFLVARIATSKVAVERFVEVALDNAKKEQVSMNIREMVSPKIQKRLGKMVVLLDADRVFVIEMHNGKKNATELPFKYFDMTYEEVNEDRNIKNVSHLFMEMPITHYKLPFYLARNGKFMGTGEELEVIDRRFANNFTDENGDYLAIMTLRSRGCEIGFLGVSYDKGAKVPSIDLIGSVMERESKIIAELLDLNAQESLLKSENDEQ